MTNNNNWTKNPDLRGISPDKLNLLTSILSQAQNKTPNELIPFFLAASQKANSQGVSFNDNETDVIINTLKQNMSPEDQNKIESIRKLSQVITSKNKK